MFLVLFAFVVTCLDSAKVTFAQNETDAALSARSLATLFRAE